MFSAKFQNSGILFQQTIPPKQKESETFFFEPIGIIAKLVFLGKINPIENVEMKLIEFWNFFRTYTSFKSELLFLLHSRKQNGEKQFLMIFQLERLKNIPNRLTIPYDN